MKQIMLITTSGCEACTIMEHSIREALASTKKEGILFSIVSRSEFLRENRELYNKLNIKLRDFPTTLFIKDDRVIRKEVGTRPTIVVLRWIDIDFK